MALPVSIYDVRPHQRSARSSRQLPKHHNRTSSNSTLGSDGCRYCKRDSGMLSRFQEPGSPTMSAPNHPPGPKRHVLHRQPRLSSLSRQRELAEKGARDGVADLHDGTSRKTGTAWFAGPKITRDLATSYATSDGWEPIRSGTNPSRSFEWETETLLNMLSYPCPYRKRNPARFNFRDHEACARAPFKSALDLVHHISDHHRRKSVRHQCRRCKQSFDSQTDLEQHILLPREQMCEVDSVSFDDPEDGITDEQAMTMVTAGYAPEEMWTWKKIWLWVFPDDSEVPDSDFPPVVELVEIDQAFDDSQEVLKASLQEKLELLLPDAIGDDYISFLAGQLELVFETHRVNIIKQCISRSCLSCPATNRDLPPGAPSSQQQNHPPKPNRRSRRSTLLQSLHRSGPDPAGGSTFRRHSRTNSARRTSHQLNEHVHLNKTVPHTRFSANSTLTNSSEEIEALSPRTIENTATATNANIPNPRDSRDSGIGMPCETCDADPCRCGDAAVRVSSDMQHLKSKSNIGPDRQDQQQHPQQRTGISPDLYISSPSTRGQRQPRLSLNTCTDSLLVGHGFARGEGAVESAGTSAGGRFSPESFKQRVLRGQQLVGV